MEPDHSANIVNFLKAYPDTIVVASSKAFTMMKNFFGKDFTENGMVIKEGDTLTGNLYDASNPDMLTIENKNGSYSGSFTSGYMHSAYGSSVPSGWLIPMPYLNIGRKEPIAKVRLIVPHSEGQSNATSYVYPCFYEITYRKGR